MMRVKTSCNLAERDWTKRGEFVVPVEIFNQQNELVFTAHITMYVSNKLQKAA